VDSFKCLEKIKIKRPSIDTDNQWSLICPISVSITPMSMKTDLGVRSANIVNHKKQNNIRGIDEIWQEKSMRTRTNRRRLRL
jgi:hypothetical protein